jgi:hypothetical protein
VSPDAPEIAVQPLPFASQLIQATAVDVGVPLQVPLFAVRAEPTEGVPEMLGAVVGVGAVVLETTADGADVALAEPLVFFAVTVTRSVCATSAVTALYVAEVAPSIAAHEFPLASHRLHAYVYELGVFVQVPLLVDSSCPSWAVPEIVGVAVFAGPPSAARPLPGWPKTAPISAAATAMTIAVPMFKRFIQPLLRIAIGTTKKA